MGPRIRVLVVDDAVVVRKMVGDALKSDPAIEVVGTAATGRIALQKIPQVNPDVVTLDVEMPDMDGLETLAAIRKTWPALPVVMFSTLTERGATATLEALARGASDYVTKPSGTASLDEGLRCVREELLPKIHALCKAPSLPDPAVRPPITPSPSGSTRIATPLPPRARGEVGIVAVAVSTGGPNALAVLIPGLPRALPVPVVITQHMPPMFTGMLASRLDSPTGLHVVEGAEGMTLEAGTAYVAPGDRHMVFERRGAGVVIRLTQDPPENSCRPAADPMFRSVVAHFGASTLGVVLTGMGHDGTRGCECIRAAGGHVLVQDEASSVVWGMPGAVARAGLADAVLPIDRLAAEIVRRVTRESPVPVRSA